jgi:hypothetical protein
MTAYSQTIRNTCRVWGPEPTEKWYSAACGTVSLVWGTDNWAYGTVGLPTVFTKGIAAGSTVISTKPNFNMTKGVADSVAPLSIISGKAVSKGISETVANTTTANWKMVKGITDSVANTTAVGKGILHAIYEIMPITESVSYGRTLYRRMYGSLVLDDAEEIYSMRDDYYRIYVGISNVVSWPRNTGYTSTVASALTWSQGAATSTSWV